MTASLLPRTSTKDRRTAAERMPQAPVTVRYVLDDEQHETDILVGAGGWLGDERNALARLIGDEAAQRAQILTVGPHARAVLIHPTRPVD